MKSLFSLPRLTAIALSVAAFSAATAVAQPASTAKDELEALKIAARPLEFAPPANGAAKPADSFAQEQKMQSAGFVNAAKLAREFYAKHPDDANASQARKIEVVSLLRAVNTGTVEVEPQALRLADAYRADKSNASRDRYEVALSVIEHDVMRKKIGDRATLTKEYHDRAMDLYGEFPNEPQLFALLLGVAQNAEPTLARSTASELLRMPAPSAVKQQAQVVIDRLDLPGKKVAFEWQDEAGKPHSSAEFSGSPVVFFVWASWTPATADAVKALQSAIKSGVQLVSVNVDTDLVAGKAAYAKNAIGGVAYFDNRGLQGPLPAQLKASQVPSVYVVDAKGVFVGAGHATDLPGLLATAAGI